MVVQPTRANFEFAGQFQIPPEFPEVLKAFTREVLRIQPANIEDFAVKYFERCEGGEYANQEEEEELSLDRIEEIVQNLFTEYDRDHNGYLDAKEFRELMNDFSSRVSMPKDEIYRFMAEADMDDDGKIQYAEFVPVALTIIQTLHAQKRMYSQDEVVTQAAEDYLVHGMTETELTGIMTDIFQKMDISQTGRLSKAEFIGGLTHMELGLTRREINAIILQVDTNEDGEITYEEAVPFFFNVLQKMTAMKMLENEMANDELAVLITNLFHERDTTDSGLVYFDDIKDVLHQAQLGLSRVQLYAVDSAAEPNDEGYVLYREFVPRAVTIIKDMLSFEKNVAMSKREKQENLDDIEAPINALFNGLSDTCTFIEFENACGQSGLFNEKELMAVLQLGMAGKSKTALRESNEPIDIATVRRLGFRLMKQMQGF